MEEAISLRELFGTLKKRLLLIVGMTVVATLISGIISYFVLTPIYQASTQILVSEDKTNQPMYNVSEIQTNLQLINTYNVIIKSPAILDIVINKLELQENIEKLNEQIHVVSEKDSQVVAITVNDPDPYMAAKIANTIADVFQHEIVKIMKVDNVNILSEAKVKSNPVPVKPQPILNMAIAMVVGFMIGVGISFLLEYLDNTIKNEQDVERILGLPVLGSISIIDKEQNQEVKKTRSAGI